MCFAQNKGDLCRHRDALCPTNPDSPQQLKPNVSQEFSDDEEERRVKRAEKAKRKAEASEASEGDVVAVDSDDSRQGTKCSSELNLHHYMKFNYAFQRARAGVDIGTREEPRTTATLSSIGSRGDSIHGEKITAA